MNAEIKKIIDNLEIPNTYMVGMDSNVHFYSCIENSLYSYLVENMGTKDSYIDSILEVVTKILEESGIEYETVERKKTFKDLFRGR